MRYAIDAEPIDVCHCRCCADAQPQTIDIIVASLDQPELVAPREPIWMSRALPWLDDDLPRYERRAPVSE